MLYLSQSQKISFHIIKTAFFFLEWELAKLSVLLKTLFLYRFLCIFSKSTKITYCVMESPAPKITVDQTKQWKSKITYCVMESLKNNKKSSLFNNAQIFYKTRITHTTYRCCSYSLHHIPNLYKVSK